MGISVRYSPDVALMGDMAFDVGSGQRKERDRQRADQLLQADLDRSARQQSQAAQLQAQRQSQAAQIQAQKDRDMLLNDFEKERIDSERDYREQVAKDQMDRKAELANIELENRVANAKAADYQRAQERQTSHEAIDKSDYLTEEQKTRAHQAVDAKFGVGEKQIDEILSAMKSQEKEYKPGDTRVRKFNGNDREEIMNEKGLWVNTPAQEHLDELEKMRVQNEHQLNIEKLRTKNRAKPDSDNNDEAEQIAKEEARFEKEKKETVSSLAQDRDEYKRDIAEQEKIIREAENMEQKAKLENAPTETYSNRITTAREKLKDLKQNFDKIDKQYREARSAKFVPKTKTTTVPEKQPEQVNSSEAPKVLTRDMVKTYFQKPEADLGHLKDPRLREFVDAVVMPALDLLPPEEKNTATRILSGDYTKSLVARMLPGIKDRAVKDYLIETFNLGE